MSTADDRCLGPGDDSSYAGRLPGEFPVRERSRARSCSTCRFWARVNDWEFQGFPGLVGECKSPLILDLYQRAYDPRGVFHHEEYGFTRRITSGPEFGCLNWEMKQP